MSDAPKMRFIEMTGHTLSRIITVKELHSHNLSAAGSATILLFASTNWVTSKSGVTTAGTSSADYSATTTSGSDKSPAWSGYSECDALAGSACMPGGGLGLQNRWVWC